MRSAHLLLVVLLFALYDLSMVLYLLHQHFGDDSKPIKEETRRISNNISANEQIKYWFFTSSDDTKYINSAKIAVLSSQTMTTLKPVCMYFTSSSSSTYSSSSNSFQNWLIEHGVIVINIHASNYDILHKISSMNNLVGDETLGLSSWIRIIIPYVIEDMRNKSIVSLDSLLDYILYTDADVIFHAPLDGITMPRYLSFAIQGDKYCCRKINYERKSHINAGILVMNVSGYRECTKDFFNYILTKNTKGFNDQAALKEFFPQQSMYQIYHSNYFVGRLSLFMLQKKVYTSLSMHRKYYSNSLPKYINWEPYLGVNKNAVILHFHGFKLIFDTSTCNNLMSGNNYDSNIDSILNFSYINQSPIQKRVSTLLGNTSKSGYRYAAELYYSYQRIICTDT